jgi:hypothetical protein
MANWQTKLTIILSLIGNCHLRSLAQTNSDLLIFHTMLGLEVTVHKGSIKVNNRNLYKIQDEEFLFPSKRNRLIENGGSVFMFLEINGSPNKDRLYVLKITKDKVDSIANSISSEIRDFDGDSYLEFGGSDLIEVHPSNDSMYYILS